MERLNLLDTGQQAGLVIAGAMRISPPLGGPTVSPEHDQTRPLKGVFDWRWLGVDGHFSLAGKVRQQVHRLVIPWCRTGAGRCRCRLETHKTKSNRLGHGLVVTRLGSRRDGAGLKEGPQPLLNNVEVRDEVALSFNHCCWMLIFS